MKIEFTKFVNGENWVSGVINDGEYSFSSKLFDKGSIFGIDDGRVSKLAISIGSKWTGWEACIVNYDRGWDIEPESAKDKEVFDAVMNFLENAPKTRF